VPEKTIREEIVFECPKKYATIKSNFKIARIMRFYMLNITIPKHIVPFNIFLLLLHCWGTLSFVRVSGKTSLAHAQQRKPRQRSRNRVSVSGSAETHQYHSSPTNTTSGWRHTQKKNAQNKKAGKKGSDCTFASKEFTLLRLCASFPRFRSGQQTVFLLQAHTIFPQIVFACKSAEFLVKEISILGI